MIGIDIKWRGKRIGKDEWLTGSLYNDGGEYYILPPFPGSAIDYEDYQVDQNTLGIWIGRKDKYGRQIYTGDLLQNEKGETWRVELMKDLMQIEVVNKDISVRRGIKFFRFDECEVLEI
jgi:hypothetical protein